MMNANIHGALLMMASMAAFTINDTFVILLGATLPLGQILFLRGAATSVILLILCWKLRALGPKLRGRDWTIIAIRTFAEIGAAYFFLTALIHMPLANVTAILQLLPLTVTLAGGLFLGERFGWRRLVAIMVGFVGMLCIVRPGTNGFDVFSLYALVAVLFVTLRDIVTHRLSKGVSSLFVTLMASIGVWVFSWVMLINTTWVPMQAAEWGYLAGAATFVGCGYLLSVLVMRVGQVSFVALFRYSGLLWALALGAVVFGDIPKPLTWLGAALIVGSGVFTILRNAQRKNRAKSL